MFLRRRRPLLRAAMIGGTAFVAGRAGQNAAIRAQAAGEREQDEQARIAELEAQQKGAEPPSMVDQLAQLAQLRQSGALTDADFEAAKQKLLAS
jgi:Short C-terminal domain